MHAATLLFLLSVISGTSHANPSWQNLKETVLQADLKAKRKGQLNLAKQAIKLADECVTTNPQEVACYYYRGQATGLYYEVVMFGYQKGVVAMIADWQKAVELDPTFDHGGPYRLMGELFTALPKYFGTKNLRQDLVKAEDYLRKAIEIDPNYPTNHFDLAELLIKAKRKPEALEAFEKAQNLTAQWNSDPYFASWQEESKEIEEQLKGEMYGKHQ
ncbi:MAG: hypothetical protein A3F82_02855 [Deltaproteobacteria bacterium RIFCSPLOWO2_12_FULL_44_12]|nr:MAG: hypothetical protein A2712_11000 [Deltaproteobacteria bacterium RIFCSPHIGHO2_01_FULL_43_49]OGQ69525.1 MAG: hypothetical protein A3F82_02855 [Deltaproteobacteria bacterium RIFCSPLOWO2_12_FULL_44_12]